MSAVLKHSSQTFDAVRGFHSSPSAFVASEPQVSMVELLEDRLNRALAETERQRVEHVTALELMRAETELAVSRAREAGAEQGRREGMAAAERSEEERLETLRAGLATEAERFGERLDMMERLAVLLARTALAKIFARPDAMAEMVCAALARHLQTLRDRSDLAIRVSAADFAEPQPLVQIARDAGAQVTVGIDRDLPAGACRISARLGQIDLDVPAQWNALCALLDQPGECP